MFDKSQNNVIVRNMKYVIILLFLLSPLHAFVKTEAVAAVIIGEAGGEGKTGMQAVASVIQNRMVRRSQSSYEVVSARKQFSCVNVVISTGTAKAWEDYIREQKRHSRWNTALKLAKEIENKNLKDITGGATHYYAHKRIAKPYWAKSMKFTCVIGGHTFYRE